MECKYFQEQITASVDNELMESEQRLLEAHIAQCPACKSSLDREYATRNFVKSSCLRVQAPAHLRQSIVRQIESEAGGNPSWWKNLVGATYFRPAVAFALACLAVIIILNNDSVKRTNVMEASMLPANDVMKQAVANYVAISSGKITPQLLSADAARVEGFFSGKTEFPAFVPPMNGCTLVGGVLNEFSGKTLAHVLYHHQGNELVYVYETCWETVQKGESLQLAKEIQTELQSEGRYVASHPDGYTIALWKKGGTLCSVVAKLDRESLLACLSVIKD